MLKNVGESSLIDKKKFRHSSARLRAQAAVESALIIVVLTAVLFGILEVSRLVFINAEIDNAAREGAHYAALTPGVSEESLRNAVASRLVLTSVSEVTITGPTYAPVAGQRCTYCRVSVTLSYQWHSVVPFLNLGPVRLGSTATALIEIADN